MEAKSLPESDLQKDIQFFEYTKAANPLSRGTITQVPYAELPSKLHEEGSTRIIPFDLSDKLMIDGRATSPNLAASFIRIKSGERITTSVNATSELYYVIRGSGTTSTRGTNIPWSVGDFFVVPGGKEAAHIANADSALYWITDEPLLRYLGVTVSKERFSPTLYTAEDCQRELEKVASDPNSIDRNRVSVLLANKNFPQTLTVTHTLWAMFGLLPVDSVQPPHRHNSVALDLILDCKPGCYTLVSRDIDEKGELVRPVRQDWKPYSAFVTPPYYWHAHHNESGAPAHLIPIQDAGLQTYMRTLDIEFAHPASPVSKEKLAAIL
jgi:gentisate 1,2-dioxygenase